MIRSPPDASPNVVRRLKELGAHITICERRAKEAGDPCFLRFREVVKAGAIPFGVQGSENGLAVEGLCFFTFGADNREDEVYYVLAELPAAVEKLRSFSPVWRKKLAAAVG